ncbi:MAG TPA: hypothetical protein VN397_03280 [Candidatus Methylomirabilis sp.]|nr:hypothetical protein [Candidatus Methylomirabilis sp.]
MRTFIAIGALFAAGCGIHSYDAETKSPTHSTIVEQKTGPYHSSSETATKTASDYRVCLAQVDGLPDKERYCQAKIWGGRPGQAGSYVATPYGSYAPYGYGGYAYRP